MAIAPVNIPNRMSSTAWEGKEETESCDGGGEMGSVGQPELEASIQFLNQLRLLSRPSESPLRADVWKR